MKADPTIVNMAFKEAMAKVPFSTEGMFDNYLKARGDTLNAITDMFGSALDLTSTLVSEKDKAFETFNEYKNSPEVGAEEFAELELIQKDLIKQRRKAKGKVGKKEIDNKIAKILKERQEDNVSTQLGLKLIDPQADFVDYQTTSDSTIWMLTQVLNNASKKGEVDASFKRDGSSGRALYSGTYTDPNTGKQESFDNVSITDLVKSIERKDPKALGEVEKVAQEQEIFSRKNKFHEWDQKTIDKTIVNYKRVINKNISAFSYLAGEEINGKTSFIQALSNPDSDMGRLILKELYTLNPQLDTNKDGELNNKDDFMTGENYKAIVENLTKPRLRGKANPNFNRDLSVDLMARYLTTTAGDDAYLEGRKLAGHDIEEKDKLSSAQRLFYAKQAASEAENEKAIEQLRNGNKLVKLGPNTTAVRMGNNYVILGRTEAGKAPQVNLEDKTHDIFKPNDIIQYLGGEIEEVKPMTDEQFQQTYGNPLVGNFKTTQQTKAQKLIDKYSN